MMARCGETSNDLHTLLPSPRAMEVPHNQAAAGPLAAFAMRCKGADPRPILALDPCSTR